jgi:hypothetical protein
MARIPSSARDWSLSFTISTALFQTIRTSISARTSFNASAQARPDARRERNWRAVSRLATNKDCTSKGGLIVAGVTTLRGREIQLEPKWLRYLCNY